MVSLELVVVWLNHMVLVSETWYVDMYRIVCKSPLYLCALLASSSSPSGTDRSSRLIHGLW